MRPRNPTPPLKCDKQGYAYVQHASIPNKSHKMRLGKFGTPESAKRYQEVLERICHGAEYVTVKSGLHEWLTVEELVEMWQKWAQQHYLRNGKISREYHNVNDALKVLVEGYGETYVCNFGPRRLLDVRDRLASSGRLQRRTANAYLSRIKRFWKWASARELCAADMHHRLSSVSGLAVGELGVREAGQVQSACLRSLDLVLPFCPPVVADMMRVQFLCVMRPAEVCGMQEQGINRQGDIWLYFPEHHKTEWRGKRLVKAIPKSAQTLLLPRLGGETGYLFDPEEARAWGREQAAATRGKRKTKRFPTSGSQPKPPSVQWFLFGWRVSHGYQSCFCQGD